MIRWIIILLMFLVVSPFVQGQISFAPYQTINTGANAEVVCVADINNDSLQDIVVANRHGSDPSFAFKIITYLQTDSGTISLDHIYSYPIIYPGVYTIDVADLNNDGLNDVVISVWSKVLIYLQDTMNVLQSPIEINSVIAGDYIDGLGIGDFNSDGLKDIALSHDTTDVISVIYQSPLGVYNEQTFVAPSSCCTNQIVIGDVNNDNFDDVVLSTGGLPGCIAIYTQGTNGLLNNYIEYPNLPSQWGGNESVDIGDLNNDGRNDIAKTSMGNVPNSKTTLYFQDSITNLLMNPLVLAANDIPCPIKIEDFDCNGKNELILGHGGFNEFSLYEQNANYQFSTYTIHSLPYVQHINPYGLSVGDINSDGKKDAVFAETFPGLVLLYNQSSMQNCCGLKNVPNKPAGDTIICNSDDTSLYFQPNYIQFDDSTFWHLYPLNCGQIIQISPDSCAIIWDSSFYGDASLIIENTNICYNTFSNPLHIHINRIPELYLGCDTILCSNDSFVLQPAASPHTSFLWQDGTTDSMFVVESSGFVWVEASNYCGTVKDSIIIESAPLPILTLPSDSVLCIGDTIFCDVGISGSAQYLWQDGSTDHVLEISQPGQYSVLVTDSNNCHNSDTIIIISAQAPIIQLPSDTSFCNHIEILIQLNNFESTYIWQDNSTDSTYVINHAGLYFVSATNFCGSDTDSVFVTEYLTPSIQLPTDTSFCKNDSIFLDVTQDNNADYYYFWQDGHNSPMYIIYEPGIYSVLITDSINCEAQHNIVVSEYSIPSPNFSELNTICAGTELTLNAFNYGSTYVWQDGSTDAQFSVIDSGLYYVTVSNFCGTVSDSTIIKLSDCTDYLELPSAFSPNYDGINDLLIPIGRNVTNVQFMIYDRWGEKVFECNCDLPQNPVISECAWNGTFRGRNLDPGVYMYYLSGNSVLDGRLIQYSGNVSLVR